MWKPRLHYLLQVFTAVFASRLRHEKWRRMSVTWRDLVWHWDTDCHIDVSDRVESLKVLCPVDPPNLFTENLNWMLLSCLLLPRPLFTQTWWMYWQCLRGDCRMRTSSSMHGRSVRSKTLFKQNIQQFNIMLTKLKIHSFFVLHLNRRQECQAWHPIPQSRLIDGRPNKCR